MRKGLTIFSLFIIIIIVFSQVLLPALANKTAETRLKSLTQAKSAQAVVVSKPPILLLLGHVDHLDLSAEDALLDEVRVHALTLKGENVRLNLLKLESADGAVIRSADQLQLEGVVTADNLTELLTKKVDQLENVKVTITPEKVQVSAQAKIAGRKADLTLEGKVLEEDGSIYFRMTKLDIRNAILGKAVISNFFGDILLTNFRKLPYQVEVDNVVQKQGEIRITASQHTKS